MKSDETPDGFAGAPRAPRRRSSLARAFRKHVRPLFSKRLSRLAAAVVPTLYVLYMRFVWRTSRIEGQDDFRLTELAAKHDGAVALLFHEEILSVPYGYPYIGIRGHALVSAGESGEVLARMLHRCGYALVRGGSSGKARRVEGVIDEMIEHMRSTPLVIYGIAVDGSKGPAYRMKTGGIVIARDCDKPIALVRTWYKRCIRLRTWDRLALPLPFNVIRYYYRGPYFVPASARTQQGLEDLRLELEDALIDLAAQSYADMGQALPVNLVKRSERSAA